MSDLKEKVDILSNTELFKPCGKEMVEQIAEFCSLYKVSKNKTIFMNGDPGNSLYIVKSGEISVLHAQDNKQAHEIARYSAGDFFGEVDMLMNTQRNAEARAAEDSEILRFPGEDKTLQDFLMASPPIGAELLRLFMQTAAARIRKANALLKENSPWVQEVRAQVYRDKLTGLYNKTFLEEQLPAYLRNKNEPVSLMMMKADNFKFINDNFGHDAGDQALVLIGAALSKYIPANTAVIVRFMGNEISCLFPGANREKALEHAQGIRNLYNSLDMSSITKNTSFNFTVSIGIAVFPDHAKTSEELIACAHELPLLGRYRGGNKILFPEDK